MQLAALPEAMNVLIEMPKDFSSVVLQFKRDPAPSPEGEALGNAEYDSWSAGLLEYDSWFGG